MNINECKSPASENSVWVFEIGQLRDRVAELEAEADALQRQAVQSACPCRHTTPCSDACSCASPTMSGGCERCCTYGSAEQQKIAAERLAKMVPRAVADKLAAALDKIEKTEHCTKYAFEHGGCPSCIAKEALAEYLKAAQ